MTHDIIRALTSLGPPTITGASGSAWMAAITPELKAGWPAGLDTWLLHCPAAHPFWSWYVMTACSLRDIPGMRPAQIRTPGATHELLVFAMDPAWLPGPDWCSKGAGRWHSRRLTPQNLAWQAAADSDEQWCALIHDLVEAFCSGRVSPDTDHRRCQLELLEQRLRALRTAS